jgi:hypothetical protein
LPVDGIATKSKTKGDKGLDSPTSNVCATPEVGWADGFDFNDADSCAILGIAGRYRRARRKSVE